MHRDHVRRHRFPGFILRILTVLLFSATAHATAPSFTGVGILTPVGGGTVNLRSQGAITGSAPMVIESVSILPLGIGMSASIVNGVCVQITNTLGIDLASVAVLLSVVATNPDAPKGVRGTIAVVGGVSSNNNLSTCADPSQSPVANAGVDRTVADTDGTAGEVVTLDASASSDPDGSIVAYAWTDLATNQTLGTSARIQPRLNDGSHQIRLTVTDNSGGAQGSASTTINVVVQAAATSGPTANAGSDRSLLDTDGLVGELVTLNASASINVGGVITSYEWFDAQKNLLGTGVLLTLRLPDGVNDVVLRVTNSNLLSNSITVTIAVASSLVGNLLASIPNLTPNQRSVATTFDDLCSRLSQLATVQALLPEQVDLLNRCGGIISATNMTEQVDALDELGARDLTAIRTQSLLFSNNQYSGVMSRLAAMRSGERGINLRGLTVRIGGQVAPIEQFQEVAKKVFGVLGGGASADEQAGSLLSDRLGMWVRGNYDSGERAESALSNGFEGKQWGMTGGVDYRLAQQTVLGLALGYGKSNIDFRPLGRGGLATKSWTASLYGSTYPIGNFYVDGVLNYGRADYDTTRHIAYSEGGTTINRTAVGSTGGHTLSGGVSVGYNFNLRGFTLSPMLGYFRSQAKVDAFNENGASGLDLAYENQSYTSSTANLSLAADYALNTRWLVLLPHVRGEYVHELKDDAEVFGVRFAHDPFANDANPTPLVAVRSDVPDQWYWRLAAGVSAQFKYGISAYVEYQRLESFQYVSFENTTLGLRLQRSF